MKYSVKSFGEAFGNSFDEIFVEHDGVTITFSDLGARINRWLVPNKEGQAESIILGFDNAQHAIDGQGYYYGATIAPIAGRIKEGKITLSGQDIQLDVNENTNHLHGGENAVDLQKWDYEINENDQQIEIVFSLTLEDGFNGYPGEIRMQVKHTYTNDHVWRIDYEAISDKETIFNPTNHVYFNLSGDNQDTILNHQLNIQADHYLAVREDGLPTGEVIDVTGTPFDLRNGVILNNSLHSEDSQIAIKDGFDHPFVLNGENKAAVLSLEEKNRQITCRTSSPTIVVYTSQVIDTDTNIWGEAIKKYGGITLETQMEPDAMNHEHFSDIRLKENTPFQSWTEYQLTI